VLDVVTAVRKAQVEVSGHTPSAPSINIPSTGDVAGRARTTGTTPAAGTAASSTGASVRAGTAGAARAAGAAGTSAATGAGAAGTATAAGAGAAGTSAAAGAGVAAAAGPVGIALAALAVAAIAAVVALKAIVSAADDMADRYGQYSPEIAQAQAIAEIRQTMGDLRRAQEIAPEMAKYIIARVDLQQKWEDIKVRLMKAVLPIATAILRAIEFLMPIVEVAAAGVEFLLAPINMIAEAIAELLNLGKKASEPEIVDPTSQIFDPKFNEGGAWVPAF
jgi:hypothetical protein